MKQIKIVLGVLAGNLVLALAVTVFVLPNGISVAGATGLANGFHYLLGVSFTAALYVINALIFAIGAWFLGKKFALSTIISTCSYPLFLSILENIHGLEFDTDGKILSVVYAGLLFGIGIGIIMRMGASAGGIDTIALVLNKKFHFPVAVCLYIIDFIVLLFQAVYMEIEQVLYGILVLMITTFVLNRVILFGKSQIQIFIISEKYRELGKALLKEVDVGATFVHIQTGFSEKEQQGVLCVISNRKLFAVNKLVQQIDDKAFLTITNINEVRGRGFSLAND